MHYRLVGHVATIPVPRYTRYEASGFRVLQDSQRVGSHIPVMVPDQNLNLNLVPIQGRLEVPLDKQSLTFRGHMRAGVVAGRIVGLVLDCQG